MAVDLDSCISLLTLQHHKKGDRILTLSPIPSSSSLYGMKSSSSSHRPRLSESQRRTSTSSFSTYEVASSPPTQMDMSGYATLKTINKHRRPHLSESAASGSSELDDLTWLLTDTQRRSKPFSSLRDRAKSTRERMTKLSLLDYDWKPLPLSEGGRTTPPPAAREPPRRPPQTPCAPPSHPAHPPHLPPAPHVPHPPPYIGICLPRDLKELFPRDEDGKEDIETEKRVPFGRTGLNLFPAEYGNISTDNKTSDTPEHHSAHHKDGTPHTLPISVPQTTGINVTTVAGNTNNNISFEIPEDVKISKQEEEIKNTVKIDTGKPYDDIKINKILNLDKIQETSTDNINVTKTDNIEKVSSPDHVAKFLPGSVPKSATLPDKVSTKFNAQYLYLQLSENKQVNPKYKFQKTKSKAELDLDRELPGVAISNTFILSMSNVHIYF
ncbi:hypothetical protein RR48_01581 [Papilio machaon]|uniref:Uncharacterized protein n=1 Tax=Papilio machaon TaxID=76193 RepID=A0A0N0PE57_PAPMA|nr:hypothetical protein RR48_01581 [Papilio machaon]